MEALRKLLYAEMSSSPHATRSAGLARGPLPQGGESPCSSPGKKENGHWPFSFAYELSWDY